MRQDRGLRPQDRLWAARASVGRSLDYESAGPARGCLLLSKEGRNGIYLFELEAQPGGPEGRSDTAAGSKPIYAVERPRSVPALRSCLVVVDGTESWFHSGNTSSRTRYGHIVPISRTKRRMPLFLHTRYSLTDLRSDPQPSNPTIRAPRLSSPPGNGLPKPSGGRFFQRQFPFVVFIYRCTVRFVVPSAWAISDTFSPFARSSFARLGSLFVVPGFLPLKSPFPLAMSMPIR